MSKLTLNFEDEEAKEYFLQLVDSVLGVDLKSKEKQEGDAYTDSVTYEMDTYAIDTINIKTIK